MKIIAIPTKNNIVGLPFGYCKYYSIYTINDNNIVENLELLKSPQGCRYTSKIAPILLEKGVNIMLTDTMGKNAINILCSKNIEVFTGFKGNVSDVINQYLNKEFSNRSNCESYDSY